MSYTNFKRIVPTALQEKVRLLANSVDLHDLISGHQESMSEQTVHEIEGNYRDGWMPNQDGGYSVDQLYMSDMDSCRHFTENQTECMSAYYDDMLKTFMSDNDIEEMDYDDQGLLDRLYEYDSEWWEPALLQFQVFVERKDKFDDESPFNVVCRLSINYKDAPYYREKYAEDILFRTYRPMEFMQTENHVIIEQFKI